MILWLCAGYGETGTGGPNSAKFRGGGCRGSQDLTKGEGSNNFFLSDKSIHFLEFLC